MQFELWNNRGPCTPKQLECLRREVRKRGIPTRQLEPREAFQRKRVKKQQRARMIRHKPSGFASWHRYEAVSVKGKMQTRYPRF